VRTLFGSRSNIPHLLAMFSECNIQKTEEFCGPAAHHSVQFFLTAFFY
jgi:hypothetical protein